MTSPSPIRILSMDAKVRAVDIVGNLPEDGEWWVHYRKSGEGRSQKQRRLMAMWAEEWVVWLKHNKSDAFTHLTPDEAYNSFKWRCVLPKLIAGDTTGFWQGLKSRILNMHTEEAILKFAGECINSDNLSTEEYFEAMEHWADWTRHERQSNGRFMPTDPDEKRYRDMWR